MGVAALVLGIISLLLSFIPVIGLLGIGLAIIGLILGIIDWVQKKKKEEKHGLAIAGVICAAVAIVIVMLYTALAGVLFVNFASNVDSEKVQNFLNTFEEININELEHNL